MLNHKKTELNKCKLIILKKLKPVKSDYVHLVYPFATKNFVSELHKKGYKVIVWIVNNPKLVKKMIEKKVDGIISDYPDIL